MAVFNFGTNRELSLFKHNLARGKGLEGQYKDIRRKKEVLKKEVLKEKDGFIEGQY